MTPLASQLAKQLVCRPTKRKHIWRAPENLKHLRESLTDIHCFEVTAILPLLGEMAEISKTTDEARTESLYSTYAFLPAPKTWIEWRHGSGNRIGILLEEASRPEQRHEQNRVAVLTFFSEILAQNLGIISQVSSDYFDYGGERHFPTWLTYGGGNVPAGLIAAAHTMLVLINSPKIIGRAQFMPNAGLERRLTRGLGAGTFPLHAWTEIKLQVSKPTEIDDGEPHEAHLTGRRALHFVRKHIRIRLGRLEYVSAHWRGDPAIGIKQTRYTVTP